MKKIIFIITAVASVFITSCNNSNQENFNSPKETFTAKETFELLKGDVLLIDVREPEELEEQSYDVKNVINIPLDSIESKIAAIPKNKQVILACRSGKRSGTAFNLLKEKGLTNIASMEGGINAWKEAGFPTKTGNSSKKACCENPNSKDCNPDGTCKTDKPKVEKKACCENPNSKNCNPDGTCKTDKTTISKKACCANPKSKVSNPHETAKPISSNVSAAKNRLEVYAFHGTRQCETCKNMKANTKAVLDTYFANELKSGKIVFQIIDVDDEKNEKLAEKFQATGTALMINKVVNGKDNITDWSNFAFEKANAPESFIPELKAMIDKALK